MSEEQFCLLWTPNTIPMGQKRSRKTIESELRSFHCSITLRIEIVLAIAGERNKYPVPLSIEPSRLALYTADMHPVKFARSSWSLNTSEKPKKVHFAAKLDVKLFSSEQMPLAVSRGEILGDDCNGTDSNFPKFTFGGQKDENKEKLSMRLMNMPAWIDLNADVALESLTLCPGRTSILGRVRLRNIEYYKVVSVHFTFDSWRTTRWVWGEYVESDADGEFDRFVFSMPLNDLLSRGEKKTLVFTVKYVVVGREIWDNNLGQNYLATFTKCSLEPNALTPGPRQHFYSRSLSSIGILAPITPCPQTKPTTTTLASPHGLEPKEAVCAPPVLSPLDVEYEDRVGIQYLLLLKKCVFGSWYFQPIFNFQVLTYSNSLFCTDSVSSPAQDLCSTATTHPPESAFLRCWGWIR